MLAFFDTSIHLDILRGTRPLSHVLQAVDNPPVRLSLVVASELLRGVSGRGRRTVMRVVRGLAPLEPPSWRACWLETGRLLPRVFPNHETIGLARLQNDLLLALTARYTAALFVTADAHFAALRRHVPFTVQVLSRA